MNKHLLLCNKDVQGVYQLPGRRLKHHFIVIILEVVALIMQFGFSDDIIF